MTPNKTPESNPSSNQTPNDQIPHIAVFTIGYIVYQQLPDGNFLPSGVDKDTIQLKIEANSAEEGMAKAKTLVEDMRELWLKTHNPLKSKQADST